MNRRFSNTQSFGGLTVGGDSRTFATMTVGP
jgi:hypothetical protein